MEKYLFWLLCVGYIIVHFGGVEVTAVPERRFSSERVLGGIDQAVSTFHNLLLSVTNYHNEFMNHSR